MADSEVLFTNVKIIDGSGGSPYTGEVLVRGKRISRVARNARSFASGGGTVIDGDPLADIRILQDKQRILAVMKDGEFHRAPAPRDVRSSAPTRWQAVAA